MRVSHFLIPIGVVFDGIVCFWYHLGGIYTMQEPSYLGKSILVSMWFRMVMAPIRTHIYVKDSLILTYPSNINFLFMVLVPFWYPRIGSLISWSVMMLFHIHAFTSIVVQHWCKPYGAVISFLRFLRGIFRVEPTCLHFFNGAFWASTNNIYAFRQVEQPFFHRQKTLARSWS